LSEVRSRKPTTDYLQKSFFRDHGYLRESKQLGSSWLMLASSRLMLFFLFEHSMLSASNETVWWLNC